MVWQYDRSAGQRGSLGRCARCATRPVCLSADLKDDALRRLPQLMAKSGSLQTGAHLYRAGDRADAHYYVCSGSFKTYTASVEGDERITGFYIPGEVLSCTLGDDGRLDGAVALEPATACRLNHDDVLALNSVGCLSHFFQKQTERETKLLDHQLILSSPSAQARFVGFCLQYSDRLLALGRRSDILPTPMSRTDIANYLGMTLESLSRVTSRFSKVGLIHSSRTHIELLDSDTLRTI